jgi:hypothetical protein
MAATEQTAITRAACAFELARRPSYWGAILAALIACVAVSTSTLAPTTIGIALATWTATGSPRVRRYLHRERRRRHRVAQRDRRETKLEQAGVSGHGLRDLAALVDRVADRDHTGATRLELEHLLDYYVETAIMLAGYRELLSESDRMALVRSLSTLGSDSPRRALIERRLEYRARCLARAARLEEELVAIVELIRVLAFRALMTPIAGDADLSEDATAAALDERLALFDATDPLRGETEPPSGDAEPRSNDSR